MIKNITPLPKLVLKIQFIDISSIKMDLVFLNKKYIKNENENNYQYFKNNIDDYILWSAQDFIFDKRQIRLPDETNLSKVMTHVCIFENHKEKYHTLKKLYNTLTSWSEYDDDVIYSDKKEKIKLKGKYWYVF